MKPISSRILASIALASLAVALRWPAAASSLVGAPRSQGMQEESAGTLTTLYATDPVACSLDLSSGAMGLIVQDGEVRNRNSHLSLGYHPDSLTVAVQGGDRGAIVDLGSAPEVAALAGTELVGNGGNAYVALRRPSALEHPALQELASSAHAPIVVGHVYLARIAGSDGPDLYVKLMVLEFQPGASVTLRWQRLD